jgi:cytochrome bd ubiquinol oxidase subunit I
MEWLDALTLARIQFAFTVSFHIIFPAFTIGLASYMAVLNGLHLWTGKEVYLTLFNYWKKIFAVAFGMGVVSGIVMSYQFGSNWSVFSDKTGPVLGPLMGYEVMSAFFLEAGFLGVMLFGRARVGPKLHFFATAMVAVGTFMSAFWILSVNSWMQTPAGYAINDVGQFIVVDWFKVIFNPSFPYRLVHMLLAAYLTTAFVVGAVAAYHLLKERMSRGQPGAAPSPESQAATRVMFSMAMWMAAIVAPIQIMAGDAHGLNTLEYQPAKIAAIEGHTESQGKAPLILIGIPNAKEERIDYAISVPYLSSLILTHSLDGVVPGIRSTPVADRPPLGIVFFAFRSMVGIGMLMLCLGLWSLWLRYRGRLYDTPLMHRCAVIMGPSGFIAILSGWIVTEVGRQPFTVYNLLRTADSHSPIDATAIAFSLAAFVIVYFSLFGAGVYYILRQMKAPPGEGHGAADLSAHEPIRAAGIVPGPTLAAKSHQDGSTGDQGART